MSETYVITFQVRSSQRDRFLALLGPVLDTMRHEANFEYAALHVDPDDDNRFELHETWRDREDVLNIQLKRSYRAAWHDALNELLETPRSIRTWTPIRRDVGRIAIAEHS